MRSTVESDSFGVQLWAAVGRVDPTLPVTSLKAMEAQIGESLFVERMVAALSARDPLTFGVATLALVTTAFVAGLVPAVRAARVDPMTALRYE